MVKGRIFDIKQIAVHDGPGIRTTVFFKGCPMECWWCHNPEGISDSDELFFYESKCIDCGQCIEICPEEAIARKDGKITILRDRCTNCGKCSLICPSNALQTAGREVTVDEVMNEIKKSRLYFDSSDGGVTFSGGEPFLQIDFFEELLRECKKEGFHTVVDTSGLISEEKLLSIIDKVDLFLYDLKLLDKEKHKKYTGVSNEQVLKNLEILDEKGKEVIIRYPLIPGINDSDEDIDKLSRFLSKFNIIKEIDLLPYHGVGEKYERLGKEYRLKNNDSPSQKNIKTIKEKLEDEGFKVKIGG